MKGLSTVQKSYVKAHNQYFALTLLDMFSTSSVHLIIDDYSVNEKGKIGFSHFYCVVEIVEGVFVNEEGFVQNNLDLNMDKPGRNILTLNKEDFKKVLKKMGLPFTNVEDKRQMRELLRNYMLTGLFNYDGYERIWGISFITNYFRQTTLIGVVQYHEEEKKFGNFVTTLNLYEFKSSFVCNKGFIENKGWYYKK